ncbi:MAG: ABC transporter substrate-binding protein [Candidatus Lambdaproteobacteria bacterium]|nr:ABC transporter substrate-binding protein [Candidatus Lambdaproteobacteria bacterium]
MNRARSIISLLGTLALALGIAGAASAQKYGGTLRTSSTANPSSLSPHEAASYTELWAVAPVYNNLVWHAPEVPLETEDTLRPDLAERWSWNADATVLTFKLKQKVRWHDGKPFTARDVKHTFDMVRGASKERLKLNPRRLWYENVAEITTRGDHEVVFRLKRTQTALLPMLASGYSPVYPAHVSAAALRTTAMGTGPFRFKEYKRDEQVQLVKNPDYFVEGRPYLDGVTMYILRAQAARNGAFIARQLDAAAPTTTFKPIYEQLKAANAGIQFIEMVTNATANVLINFSKPPFTNPRIRTAITLALDRNSIAKSVYQGGAVPGAAIIPKPWGAWGLTAEQLAQVPGFGGDAARNKEEARKLLAAEGYGPGKPLKLLVSTRALTSYVEVATWLIGELQQVGIQAELEQIETGNWYAKVARRDFQLGSNATAISIDNPDAVFYENYACNSQRNYTGYCNPAMEKRFDAQSVELDLEKRRRMVNAIDVDLQKEVARPYLVYRKDYYAHQPWVKNWIPHQSVYNCWRFTEVWLDR